MKTVFERTPEEIREEFLTYVVFELAREKYPKLIKEAEEIIKDLDTQDFLILDKLSKDLNRRIIDLIDEWKERKELFIKTFNFFARFGFPHDFSDIWEKSKLFYPDKDSEKKGDKR